MPTLPDTIGFSVWIGTPDPLLADPPPFAALGQRVPIVGGTAGLGGIAISPGTDAAAPLTSDGELTVLFAGELYNRDRLAAAVDGGAPGTDAQLLLACCQRYGVSAFRLVSGRFAAVVVGPRRVVVATDHAGSVPLYLRLSEAGMTVATEAKVLAAGATGRLDSPPGTAPVPGIRGLHRIRAGTAVAVDRTSGRWHWPARAVRTWAPAYGRSIPDPDDAVAAVADRLTAAVHARASGEPVTVVLSGGIDSSAVAALATAATGPVATVSLGTDAGDEFDAARAVARHLGTDHTELKLPAADLIAELPWAVAAAEIDDPEVLEYLLPLVALYRRLPATPRRILTGYGADIPLGGMHRTTEPLELLDGVIAADMDSFDGLNELSPLLSGVAGHWSTHPYWDRDVLDLLVSLEPGLKRRHGRDKWVLREAMRGRLPQQTLCRPKLGIHEGSGLTSAWNRMLRDAGVPAGAVPDAKRAMARSLYASAVLCAVRPDEIRIDDVLAEVAEEGGAQ
jgi:(carboxyethyl)arginine beta-lactam-synthase